MKKLAVQLALLSISIHLTACTSSLDNWNMSSTRPATIHRNAATVAPAPSQPISSNPQAQNTIGGNAAHTMDSIDRSKLWHALDKPLGKSTTWTNINTKVSYTVVPTQKATINGNNFCRHYRVTATVGGKSRVTEGTACVGPDGNWQAVTA